MAWCARVSPLEHDGRLSAAPITDLDLDAPEHQADPYPALRDLRQVLGPVVWAEAHRGWLVLGHPEVSAAFRHPDLSSERIPSFRAASARAGGAFDDVADLLSGWMVFRDPPVHGRLRTPVADRFTPRRVDALRSVVTRIGEELIGRLSLTETVDLRPALAGPLPALVIAELLGVPVEDQHRFREWSDDLAGLIFAVGAPVAGQRSLDAARHMGAYLAELMSHYRDHPADNLLSALAGLSRGGAEGHGLSDAEVVGASMLLLFAGHETTTTLISNAVGLLAAGPHGDRPSAPPTDWGRAVDEVMRYAGPSKTMVRKAGRPLTLAGQGVAAGDRVFLVIGSANRDERVFERPDDLDLDRDPNPHLGFGWGRHHCLGATLARMEASVALAMLFGRYPDLRLAEAPRWRGGILGRAAGPVRVRLVP